MARKINTKSIRFTKTENEVIPSIEQGLFYGENEKAVHVAFPWTWHEETSQPDKPNFIKLDFVYYYNSESNIASASDLWDDIRNKENFETTSISGYYSYSRYDPQSQSTPPVEYNLKIILIQAIILTNNKQAFKITYQHETAGWTGYEYILVNFIKARAVFTAKPDLCKSILNLHKVSSTGKFDDLSIPAPVAEYEYRTYVIHCYSNGSETGWFQVTSRVNKNTPHVGNYSSSTHAWTFTSRKAVGALQEIDTTGRYIFSILQGTKSLIDINTEADGQVLNTIYHYSFIPGACAYNSNEASSLPNDYVDIKFTRGIEDLQDVYYEMRVDLYQSELDHIYFAYQYDTILNSNFTGTGSDYVMIEEFEDMNTRNNASNSLLPAPRDLDISMHRLDSEFKVFIKVLLDDSLTNTSNIKYYYKFYKDGTSEPVDWTVDSSGFITVSIPDLLSNWIFKIYIYDSSSDGRSISKEFNIPQL